MVIHPRGRKVATATAKRQSANVAALVGSSVHRARPRRGDDIGLVDAVRGALEVKGAPTVAVTAHRGIVTLRGEVDDLDDIDSLEAAARTAGARDVNNLLRLARSERPAAAQPS